MQLLKLPIILARSFDPQQIEKNLTLSVKIRPVTHTVDKFEDLRESAENFE